MPLVDYSTNTAHFCSDAAFNKLYPLPIQALAEKHWTPLHVIKKAVNFLAAEDNARILDIGSGAGKFCLAAAHFKPNAFYYGIEQRKKLVMDAETTKEILQLVNVSFINGNFTQLDFRNYDHFYFFNSFYENLADTVKIDESIAYSEELYDYYNRYLYKQLEQKRAGTRLVTFHSMENEVPARYHVVGSDEESLLKYWIKV